MKFIRRVVIWLAIAVVVTSSIDGSTAAEAVGSVIQELRSSVKGAFGDSPAARQRPGVGLAIGGVVAEVEHGSGIA